MLTRRELLASLPALACCGADAAARDHGRHGGHGRGKHRKQRHHHRHPAPHPAAQPGAPDIVVVVLDDMRSSDWRALPQTQALLSDATRYPNLIYPTPLCCPSRATLLTGRYAHAHGVLRNDRMGPNNDRTGWQQFRAGGWEGKTLAVALRQAGYRTGLVSKYLNGYQAGAAVRGWDHWGAVAGQPSYVPKGANGPYLPDQWANEAATFAGTPGPVFLWFAPPNCHGTNGGNPPIPAPRHRDAFPEVENAEDRARLQSLLSIDEGIVKIAAAMGERWRQAAVLVLSDNGYLLGEHDKEGKAVPYDGATRVPMLARLPGVGGGEDARLAATPDIFPTILRAAGVEPPWPHDGRALQDAWDRDGVLLEGYGTGGQEAAPHFFGVKNVSEAYVEVAGDPPVLWRMGDGETVDHLPELSPEERRGWADRLAALKGCAGGACG